LKSFHLAYILQTYCSSNGTMFLKLVAIPITKTSYNDTIWQTG